MEQSQGFAAYFMGKILNQFSKVKNPLREIVSDDSGDTQTGYKRFEDQIFSGGYMV